MAEQAPPPYEQTAPDAEVPLPTEKANAPIDLQESGIPTVPQCVVHLKLLHALHQLRERVSSMEDLYGISSAYAITPKSLLDNSMKDLLPEVAEKRWAVYVSRAVDRFTTWLEAFKAEARCKYLTLSDMEKPMLNSDTTKVRFTKDQLPPLDVLMVWHAYMLNPRAYIEDCVRQGMLGLWFEGMPWNEVNACIDLGTGEYQPSSTAKALFEARTNLSWDNLDDPLEKTLTCPACPKRFDHPWTTYGNVLRSRAAQSQDISERLESVQIEDTKFGSGYADQDFKAFCPSCCALIDHEMLRGQKFKKDLQRLLKDDVPMPGTILDSNGIPAQAVSMLSSTTRPIDHAPRSFPNRILKAGLASAILRIVDVTNKTTYTHSETKYISAIRDEIEKGIKDPKLVSAAKGSASRAARFIPRTERIAIRTMMSRYWDNSSPWALDLIGAVIRQGTFIEKMVKINWLHSPAVGSTMDRLITKYERFFTIMSTHQTDVAVPTLDVDLAWHTHQLTPLRYYLYSCKKAKKFVDHDDKIAESALSKAFATTSKNYQKMFNEPYSMCTCWYCESIRAGHDSNAVSRLFNRSKNESISDMLHAAPSDSDKSPHISAHNAIKGDIGHGTSDMVEAGKLWSDYQKAVKKAKKEGRPIPPEPPILREANHYVFVGVVPYYMPYYGTGVYAGYPGCGSFNAGAAGNCAAGTCGGGVAMGSCGGAGGCSGGVAGGCASAAGGGCGGGGGGGCGGGGGGCGGGGGGGCGGGGGGG